MLSLKSVKSRIKIVIIIKTDPLSNPKNKPKILLKTPKPKRPIIFDNKNPSIADTINVEKKIRIKARILEICELFK